MIKFFLTLNLCLSHLAFAQVPLLLEPLSLTFSEITDLVFDGDDPDMLYVVQKGGVINAYNLTDGNVALFMDLSGVVDTRSEGGALGMAFHPRYPDSNYVYVNYTVSSGAPAQGLSTRISRFRIADRMATDPPVERIILTIPQPADNHNGGDLAFGPDGYLYVPTGDGGGGGDPFDTAQDPNSYLGKILRIDVDWSQGDRAYAIPQDNPFAGAADTLGEIYALGLRNPWQISFDRETGDLWIGDVGQGSREEIDVIRSAAGGGQNFGWSCREGGIAYPDPSFRCDGRSAAAFVEPLVDYTHDAGDRLNGVSVTGGYVYRGPDAALTGTYFFADFGRQRLFALSADGKGPDDVAVYSDLAPASVSTFGEGMDGHLYVADYRGKVYRIRAADAVSVRASVAQPLVMRVAPNPGGGTFRLALPDALTGEGRLLVYAAAGQEVYRRDRLPIRSGTAEVEVGGLPAGVYGLVLVAGGQRYVTRLAIQ